MYDATALDAAWDVAKGWTADDREALREGAARDGLRADAAGRPLREVAAELLAIADAGLKARARAAGFDADESHFLNALRDSVQRDETLADELLAKFNGRWNGDLSRIYGEYSY